MIAWYWLPIAIIFTAALTLLAFGMLKAGSDCDDWHDGFRAGMVWANDKRGRMEATK